MSRLAATEQIIREGISSGLHTGAQLCVRHRGSVIADAAYGDAAPGDPMTTDRRVLWRSACKPITAVAVAQLWEQERLHLDDPVATHVPEFARNGKAAVTLRHLLTHTAGFPHVPLPDGPREAKLAAIYQAPLEPDWTPGQRAGYHSFTAWQVLGEVVARASGEAFEAYVREHIFAPLGMGGWWIGVPPERYSEVAPVLAPLYDTKHDTPRPTYLTTREALAEPDPGANGIGPARELARFYEALMNGGELDGQRILEPETVDLFTIPHREEMFDEVFQYPMVWGLGFILEPVGRRGRMPYGYGRRASVGTFGHGGAESSVGFADRDHGLAVALAFNGQPGEKLHQRRMDGALTALYEDLGL